MLHLLAFGFPLFLILYIFYTNFLHMSSFLRYQFPIIPIITKGKTNICVKRRLPKNKGRTPKRATLLCSLLKEELSVKNNPDKVKPTKNETTTNSSDDSHNKADNVSGLEECCPSANNLGNPVYKRNEKK